MDVRIASALIEAILADAARAPGREVCGLLLGEPCDPVRAERRRSAGPDLSSGSLDVARDERVGAVRATANVAADPARSFEIDPASLFAAIRAERAGGARILGHYHSHPNGSPRPSARDAATADRPGRLWLIAAAGAVRLWRERPGGIVQNAFEPVRLVVDPLTSGCA